MVVFGVWLVGVNTVDVNMSDEGGRRRGLQCDIGEMAQCGIHVMTQRLGILDLIQMARA